MPGCAPGGAVTFFVSPKESNQRKATPLAASLRFAAGNLRCSRAECRCRTRFVRCALAAQTTTASQCTKRMHAALHSRTPPAALLGAARGGQSAIRAIAALGLGIAPSPAGGRWGWGLTTVDLVTGVALTLLRQAQDRPSLSQREREQDSGAECSKAERSDGPCGLHYPSGRAEKRRAWGGRAAQHARIVL